MASTSSLLRRAVGLLAAGAVVGSLAIAVPGIASATPPSSDRFSCAGGDYFRLEEGQLTQASDPNGTWTTLRASTSVNNAIGFRASDRYIYGMKSGSNHLFKLTASATEDLGEIDGLPRDVYNVGAIDQATGKFYVSSSQSSLHEVDIEALTASSVAFDSANFKLGQDVVIVGGWAWSVRGTEVYGIDLADPSQTKSYAFDHTYLQGGVVGGAMWFAEDDSSLLMEIRGTGVAVKFVGVGGASITTSNVAFSATGTGAIDGASCRTTRLTVTPDAQSVNYGDAAPSYTATVTGFILGENASTATDYVAPICTSTYSTTTSVASSPLTISCSGGSAADYTFTTTATSSLTVGKKSVTVSPDPQTVAYGDAAPSYTLNVTGFANGQSTGSAAGYSAPVCSSSYTSATTVASSPLTITCSGGSADDYTFDTSGTADLTVGKAILTTTPDAQRRTYGEGAPSYTLDVTGFVNGDSAGSAAGYSAPICSSSYSATTDVTASAPTISCSGGSADNYTFDNTATAEVTVDKKSLTVTPDSQSLVYGDAAPSYTLNVTGFANGQSTGSAAGYSAPVCSSSYTSTTTVASSPLTITCSGGSADNYTFNTSATSLLTVSYSSDSLSCSAARFVRLTHRDVFVASSLTGIWTKVRSAKPVSNAIAHRAVDQFLYGFARRSNSVFKVGIVGKFNLGAVTNLPVTNYVGADFDSATGLYYVVSVSGSVYRIDLDTMSASLFTLSTSSGSVRAGKDIAIVGGYLWSSASGYIFKANLTTGEVTKYTGWTHGTLGAMWVNADGVTVSGQVRATGEVFSVTDLSAPASSSVSLGTVPTGDKIDGATCR